MTCFAKFTAGAELRFMLRKHLAAVSRVDAASFCDPWGRQQFERVLTSETDVGIVAIVEGLVVGFCVYEVHGLSVRIHSLAVLPEYRRRGIGSRLLAGIKKRNGNTFQRAVSACVHERNNGAIGFFRANQFRAVEVVRGAFGVAGENDGYDFRFQR